MFLPCCTLAFVSSYDIFIVCLRKKAVAMFGGGNVGTILKKTKILV